MVVYNAFTGLRRRLPKHKLNWKVRRTHSSTVSARMFGKDAMLAFRKYNKMAQNCLVCAAVLMMNNNHTTPGFSSLFYFVLMYSAVCYRKSRRMLQLESDLLDIPEDELEDEDQRFHKELVDFSLDSFEDDNECDVNTRFTKQEIRDILELLDLPPDIRVYYNGNKYFKFSAERLLLYTLMRWTNDNTHQAMTKTFGGCPSRWSRGYSFLVNYIDQRYYSLIGPEGLRHWCPFFPEFSEFLREYIQRDKPRYNYNDGRQYNLTMENRYGPYEFNVFGFTDCTVYETCRPGSGPVSSDGDFDGAIDRRPDWYIKQRAFYDGFHKGMEACAKILTICLPNGLTAAVYGPTSGRRDDKTCFHLSQFDDCLHDLCLDIHGGDLYCTYGDGIFAGNWFCLRSYHSPPAGFQLAQWQKEENANMKSARVSVEWSYAKAEKLWPFLTNKRNFKIDQDPDRAFAEIRSIYFFTNLKVCCEEGSTMTGHRGFRCPPPSMREYVSMLNQNNHNN